MSGEAATTRRKLIPPQTLAGRGFAAQFLGIAAYECLHRAPTRPPATKLSSEDACWDIKEREDGNIKCAEVKARGLRDGDSLVFPSRRARKEKRISVSQDICAQDN